MLADQWDDWGECSVRCGTGIKRRVRRVLQAPLNGGRPCSGNIVEKAVCEGTSCKVARASNGIDELRGRSLYTPLTTENNKGKKGKLPQWLVDRLTIPTAQGMRALNSRSHGLEPAVSIHSSLAAIGALNDVGGTPNLSPRHLPFTSVTHFLNGLLLIYRPWKDERLSWFRWLTHSGQFTLKVVACPTISQAHCRTGKFRRSRTSVLPLCYAANCATPRSTPGENNTIM